MAIFMTSSLDRKRIDDLMEELSNLKKSIGGSSKIVRSSVESGKIIVLMKMILNIKLEVFNLE